MDTTLLGVMQALASGERETKISTAEAEAHDAVGCPRSRHGGATPLGLLLLLWLHLTLFSFLLLARVQLKKCLSLSSKPLDCSLLDGGEGLSVSGADVFDGDLDEPLVAQVDPPEVLHAPVVLVARSIVVTQKN